LLEREGYEGSSAVTVPDAQNQILIHIKEVTIIQDAQKQACQAAVEAYPGAKLTDFTFPEEGSKIFLKFASQPVYSEIEELLGKAGCEGKVEKGTGKAESFPVEVSLTGVATRITEQINEAFGPGTIKQIVSSETVGAKVGNQLKIDGAMSLIFAIGFIFLYVMVRFDLRFAPGGIVALAHDAFLVVGAFAISHKEFNLQTVAALLTVVGYSINDTIVVFDRIREKVALQRDVPIEQTTNEALNETLSRTILTSGTTLLVVSSIWILGSGPIKDFAFSLVIGMIAGTYSTLFIASPIFLWVNKRFYGGRGHLLDLQKQEREGTGTLLSEEMQPGAEEGLNVVESGQTPTQDEPLGDEESQPVSPSKEKTSRRRRRPQSP